MTATVGNAGGSSATTTLRWYRFTDSTIDINDTPIKMFVLGLGFLALKAKETEIFLYKDLNKKSNGFRILLSR